MPTAKRPSPGKRLRWRGEAGLIHGWLRLCRALSPERASDLGARVGQTVGPRLPYSHKALANMRRALPALTPDDRRRILRAMWANLGRQAAEYPHLSTLADPDAGYVEVHGLSHLQPTVDGARPAIVVGAHLANFEVMHVLLARLARPCLFVVRPPNNPRVAGPLDAWRRVGGGTTTPKGPQGKRDGLDTLAAGGLVVMLADQRMSDGIDASFFGHTAGTPPGPALLAERTGAPLLPVRMERTGPTRFRMTIEPPLATPDGADATTRRRQRTEAMNRRFEAWIRDRPADWLWLHRRWPTSTAPDAQAEAPVASPDVSR
jgi:KDO2-lipid IV(A) lauroyltransferase